MVCDCVVNMDVPDPNERYRFYSCSNVLLRVRLLTEWPIHDATPNIEDDSNNKKKKEINFSF